jgi:hypothetical protein
MKKIFYILIPVIFICILIGSDSQPQTNMRRTEVINNNLFIKNQQNTTANIQPENMKQALNCKFCHASEYPTQEDPGLHECWRKTMISVYHSPEEGPEFVVINEMSDNYMGVVFSHRIHSEMSEFSDGCIGCHHYNTTGEVLNCRNCHEKTRTRENVSIPDLKAAYHRQCMTCHQQWSHEIGCETQCHLQKGSDIENRRQEAIQAIIGKTHPKLPEPEKMIWETKYDAGTIVTFFHDEHINLFKIQCTTCHSQENCIKCHEKKDQVDFNKPVKIKKSFEDHHKPCAGCHAGETCQKCHKQKEMTPFDHDKTGWKLAPYHTSVTCTKCHGSSMPYKKVDNNCTSCHKNFSRGGFNHSSAGLVLSGNHIKLECNSCHTTGDYRIAPTCTKCHDNKSYPAQSPGKRIKK